MSPRGNRLINLAEQISCRRALERFITCNSAVPSRTFDHIKIKIMPYNLLTLNGAFGFFLMSIPYALYSALLGMISYPRRA